MKKKSTKEILAAKNQLIKKLEPLIEEKTNLYKLLPPPKIIIHKETGAMEVQHTMDVQTRRVVDAIDEAIASITTLHWERFNNG